MDILAKVAGGEQPQHAFEIGHGDLVIDQQAFHLVEHAVVRGVYRIGPIATPQRDDPNRGSRLLHHSDLHSRCLAPHQNRRVISTRTSQGRGQVEVFEWIAGRMFGRNVQSNEVVVIVFEFGAGGNTEPHAPNDVLEVLHRLGDRMPSSNDRLRSGQGHIDGGNGGNRTGEYPLAFLQGPPDLRLDLVEALAEQGPLLGIGLAQQRLQLLELSAFLTKKLDTDQLERVLEAGAGARRRR